MAMSGTEIAYVSGTELVYCLLRDERVWQRPVRVRGHEDLPAGAPTHRGRPPQAVLVYPPSCPFSPKALPFFAYSPTRLGLAPGLV
eukprot:3109657-Rhodomonas_salina.2